MLLCLSVVLAWPLAAQATVPSASLQESYTQLERAILAWRLSERDLQLFKAVSGDRAKRGLAVMGSWLGCADVKCVSEDIRSDTRTVELLRSMGSSPDDYSTIGLALFVAAHPEVFSLENDPRIRENIEFIEAHRADVARLLDRD
jgi:hypothetical protein